jgi:hypothetical protein
MYVKATDKTTLLQASFNASAAGCKNAALGKSGRVQLRQSFPAVSKEI